jgi:hypothetical protein
VKKYKIEIAKGLVLGVSRALRASRYRARFSGIEMEMPAQCDYSSGQSGTPGRTFCTGWILRR